MTVSPSHAREATKRSRKRARQSERREKEKEKEDEDLSEQDRKLTAMLAPRVKADANQSGSVLASSSPREAKEYSRKVDFVIEQLDRAAARGEEDAALNLIHYNSILLEAGNTGNVDLARSIWRRMTNVSGIEPDADSYRSYLLALHTSVRALPVEPRNATSGAARDRHVAVLSRCADTALGLVRKMGQDDIRVKDEELLWLVDMQARAGRVDRIRSILKERFGVDLGASSFMPSGASLMFQADGRAPSLFGAIVDALGELGTVSEMMGAFETLRVASSDPEVGDATREQNDVVELKTDFIGTFSRLFKGDESEAATAAAAQATAADSSASLGTAPPAEAASLAEVRHILTPTASVYRNLIRHASFPSAALEKEGASAAQTAEAAARERGQYIPLARYLVDEALDAYELEVRDLVRSLGATVKVSKEGADTSPEIVFDGSDSFLPTFDIAMTTASRDLLHPLRSRAQRLQSVSLLDIVLQKTQRARALLALEHQLLTSASVHWRQVLTQQSQYNSRPAQRRLRRFFTALRAREVILESELEGLKAWTEERLMGQVERLKLKNVARQERRKARAQLRAEEEERTKAEGEAKKIAAKQQRIQQWEEKQKVEQQAVLGEDAEGVAGQETVVRASSAV